MNRPNAWYTWIESAPLPVILDAGVGEQLLRRRAEEDPPTFPSASALWASSLLMCPQGREQIVRLAREYLEAGADILTTATYQATPHLFASEYPDTDTDSASTAGKDTTTTTTMCPFRASVALLDGVRAQFWRDTENKRSDRRRYPAIAGSVGPLASWMPNESEYVGRYSTGVTFAQFFDSHQASALKLTGADVIAFETIPCTLEAEAIASAMTNTPQLADVPYWISLQCRDAAYLANGQDTVMQAVQDVLRISGRNGNNNLVAIGANCCDIIHAPAIASNIDRAIKCFHKFNVEDHRNISIVMYPNNAYPNINNNNIARLNIVGACCRVGPSGLKDWISSRFRT